MLHILWACWSNAFSKTANIHQSAKYFLILKAFYICVRTVKWLLLYLHHILLYLYITQDLKSIFVSNYIERLLRNKRDGDC